MATKSVTPISGLANLEAAPKDADAQVSAIANASNSSDILANMQKRANELTSPWHQFQNKIDSMVAHTGYNPTQNIAVANARDATDAAELQNIGTTKAQVDMLRNQLGNMHTSFNEISGKGTPANGGTPAVGGTPANGGTPAVGGTVIRVEGIDVPFTADEIRVLNQFDKANDTAGY